MSADEPRNFKTTGGPWLAFAIAAVWIVVIRIPLILNSPSHLDSDLAVDGLTLLQATEGRFVWHYPGTPYMGAGTVLLSLPQAWIWGATPETLVSGGTVAYLGVVLATFLLAWRGFGSLTAVFALIPLTFASTGAVWLSGRITGGHLAAALFHAGLFFGFAGFLGAVPTSRIRASALGLWSGLGLYLDSMFALSLLGFCAASGAAWIASPEKKRRLSLALVYVLGFLSGVAPREIGARVDPYSAYESQFNFTTDPELLLGHAKLLVFDCLPRLFAGHRLPGLEIEPDPRTITGPGTSRSRSEVGPFNLSVALMSLSLASASFAFLLIRPTGKERLVAFGLLISILATLAAFVTNRNIFNSDNYRYLVTLLVPGAIGFGLLMRDLLLKSRRGQVAAFVLSACFAVLMSIDVERWYGRFGWVDARGLPIAAKLHDPALAWLDRHSEIDRISGSYWDVYRLIFLNGGRLKGSPYPIYPDRYPAWKRRGDEREVLVARPTPEARIFVDRAMAEGGRPLQSRRGITIISMP